MKKVFAGLALASVLFIAAACGNAGEENSSAKPETPAPASSENTSETEPPPPSKGDIEQYIFTGDEGGTITKIDIRNNAVVDTIKVEGSVHNVQVSPDGKLVGATLVPMSAETDVEAHGEGHGEGHEEESEDGHEGANGYAYFYDTSTSQLVNKVEVGNHPAHIVFTSNQKYALVTNNEDNNVSVIDLKSFEVINTLPTGQGPHGFRISSDGNTAYVANMGEDTVSVLDLTGMKELRKINVGSTPVTTAVTSDEKQLIVTLHEEDAVAIVDLASEKVEKVQVGKGPAQVYLQTDDAVAIVANQGSESQPSNTITKVDLESKKVNATIETGNGAHGVVISPDNKWIYVTNMFDNTVSVVDNKMNQEMIEIQVGQIPNGISVMP